MQRLFHEIQSDVKHLSAVVDSLFRQIEAHLANGWRNAELSDNAAMDLAIGNAARNMHLVAGLIRTLEEYLDELGGSGNGPASGPDRAGAAAFIADQRGVESQWRARLTQNQETVVEIENVQDTPPLAG